MAFIVLFYFFFNISEQREDGTASLCQVWRDYHREGHEGEIFKGTVSQDFFASCLSIKQHC